MIVLHPLAARHDLSQFQCENAALAHYLRRDALKEQESNQARVYVAVDTSDDDRLVGYFSLSATGFYIPALANDTASETFLYPVLLAFLARDSAWRGRGLGDFLLVEALKQAAEAAERIGLPGILLRTTKQGAALYERFGFVWIDRSDNYLYLPMGDVRTVAQSSGKSDE